MRVPRVRMVHLSARKAAWLAGAAASALVVAVGMPAVTVGASARPASGGYGHPGPLNCGNNTRGLCREVVNSRAIFGHYVGHDEPTVVFYSHVRGSGNQMVYQGILPREPSPTNIPGKHSYDFELYPTIWFGMILCATQSYPETVKACVPDSDRNIAKAGSPYHAGSAYLELQFYPPGWAKEFNGISCSATKWCVAMTIDSVAADPVNGTQLNKTCARRVGSEYVNFAYLTHSGRPQGPANPVDFNPVTSGAPNPRQALFLNQGDHYTVTLHDTQHGLQTIVQDTTTHQSGSMTASATNGFGQVRYAPTGTSCVNLPYNFHPMYSTSTAATALPWGAASYNIGVDTEVGHFDYCSKITHGVCTGYEGAGGNREPADADDYGCIPAAQSSLIKINGCLGANLGYDGPSYLTDWPNGTASTPTPTLFSSPLTGPAYNMNYQQVAFNTDLPAIEGSIGTCNTRTGAGCSLYPPTDDNHAPAQFYPYYTMGRVGGACYWAPGQDVPGFSIRDFGQNTQYGTLQKVVYPSLDGTTQSFYNNYNGLLSGNPCKA